ncbi:CPBP family intramembrane glutamic endopeptidase [Melghirimyces profundicolus]|uniref:CPBP family intramembrane glutamic endopeptidase n=1 Tax=Melghirimyces profundicolus TaxID=1242148 RepID=UPI001475A96C|nr:CPBP family intramembrane glutamic endopeptidase [Melghirimyces profundicolus]
MDSRDERLLFWNLCLTQVLVTLAALGLLAYQGRLGWELWMPAGWDMWFAGLAAGLTVVAADLFLYRSVLRKWLDDGGLNKLLFGKMSPGGIVWVSAGVAVSEEMLFRGALQYWLGILLTSLLFTLIHFRYLRSWLMTALLFAVSLFLGWVTEVSGSLVPATMAHFTLNLVLGLLLRFGKVR